jgi:hypothetical protein
VSTVTGTVDTRQNAVIFVVTSSIDFVLQNKRVWNICFFHCNFNRRVWRAVLVDCRVINPVVEWEDVVSWSVTHLTGTSLWANLCRLCLGASVYHL